jgi:hypothetical protein
VNPPLYEYYAVQWNGSRLREFDLPDGVKFASRIDALSPDDAWIVGTSDDNSPITVHWDGVAWSVVPNPLDQIRDGNLDFHDIAMMGPNDVWAVAAKVSADPDLPRLILHWDGRTWSFADGRNGAVIRP